MATLTNITAEPLEVHIGSGEFLLIEAGESKDVSDYRLADFVWPAATWRIDGTDVVTLQGDAYQTPTEPEPAPAVVDAPLPESE